MILEETLLIISSSLAIVHQVCALVNAEIGAAKAVIIATMTKTVT